MRVLVTVRDLSKVKLGGIGNYYQSLRSHFRCIVFFFTIGKRPGRRGWWEDPIRLVADGALCWKELSNNYDVVNINPSFGTAGLLRDGLTLILAKSRKKRTVVFFRGWDDEIASTVARRFSWLFSQVFGRADAMIVLSERFVRTLRRLGYRKAIYVETTTVDEALVSGGEGDDRGNKQEVVRLLFLARIEKDKGVFSLIESMRLIGNGSTVRLAIAGDGRAREGAEKLAENYGLSSINFCGYVSGKDKAQRYFDADLYIFPSNHGEGMPNSVLEAMACGLPVITTAVGGLPDFFEDGKMGFMIERPDPKVIAEKVQYLVDHPDERRAMGRYNAEFAKKYFMASVVAKRLERIWESVLDGTAEPGKTYHWREDR